MFVYRNWFRIGGDIPDIKVKKSLQRKQEYCIKAATDGIGHSIKGALSRSLFYRSSIRVPHFGQYAKSSSVSYPQAGQT